MPNKHEAILPDGTVATRKSASRVYTHCVAYRASYDTALRRANRPSREGVKVDRSNYFYHLALMNGTSRHLGPRDWETSPAQLERRAKEDADSIARAKRELEGCSDLDEYLEKLRKRRVEDVEALKAKGYYDRWRVEGWNGRLDLAQKLASQLSGKAHVAEVKIIEAKIV